MGVGRKSHGASGSDGVPILGPLLSRNQETGICLTVFPTCCSSSSPLQSLRLAIPSLPLFMGLHVHECLWKGEKVSKWFSFKQSLTKYFTITATVKP